MTKISYTKPFLLLQGQPEQLKQRGMKFADEEKALHRVSTRHGAMRRRVRQQ
jgi:hypothetical protein